MIDNKIKEYRMIHKRCKWCKYYKYNVNIHWTDCCYGECVLKDKYIKYESLPRLCKYYELKGDEKNGKN